MITVEERIRIFQERKVVLWGAGDFGSRYLRQFQLYELNVVALCDNNIVLQGTKLEGLPIISPKELQKIVEEDDSVVVQVTIDTTVTDTLEKEIQKQIESLGVKYYFAFSDEVQYMFDYMYVYKMVDVSSKFTGSQEEKKIRITKIDEELSIYKENKVVLCGDRIEEVVLSLFRHHKVTVFAVCIMGNQLMESVLEGIPVISLTELEGMVLRGEHVMVQSTTTMKEQETLEKIQSIGLWNYILYDEAYQVLSYVKSYQERMQAILLENKKREIVNEYAMRHTKNLERLEEETNSYIHKSGCSENIIICMNTKMGDMTLGSTFEKYNIEHNNTWHRPNLLRRDDWEEEKNMKIITAVREPINQWLSRVYHCINALVTYFPDGRSLQPFAIEAILRDGGDAQYIFDRTMDWQRSYLKQGYSNIGSFMSRFDESVINTRQVPFNYEQGYTIVKEGNVEVFIYQLERMNDIVQAVSEFVGTPFTKWEVSNVAENKWIADSYKQAQKEIKISREYFDICYNDPYVRHFYSEEDIEKFKERWRSHIR